MARIRSIKPDFWTSEQVMECSPIARLMFIGMWNFADDHGRLPCSPKTIKAQIFPGDDIDSTNVRGMIDELSSNGLVRLYVVDGKQYLFITGWHHQKIDKRQTAKYPDPPKEQSTKVRRTVSTDLRGSEGIGEDRIEETSPAAAVDDWPENYGELFWNDYPRKEEKISAMKKLATIRKAGIVTFSDLMAGVKRYCSLNRDPQFTKQPTAWLNKGCWTDEIAAARDPPAKPLTEFQKGQRELKEILNDLDNFSRGGSSGNQENIGLLLDHSGQRSATVRGGFDEAVVDLPPGGGRSGNRSG